MGSRAAGPRPARSPRAASVNAAFPSVTGAGGRPHARNPSCGRGWPRGPGRPPALAHPGRRQEGRGSVDPASRSGVTMWAAAPRRALLLLASVHATTSPSTPAADITNGSPTLLQMPGGCTHVARRQSGDPGDPKGEWDPFCPGKMRPQHAASWHLCFGTDWSLTGVRSPQHAAPWAGCSVSAHSVGHVLARALGLCPTLLPTGTSGVPPPASAGTASSPWPPALALGSRLSTEQPGKASRVELLANEERQKHPAPACPPLTAVPREVAVWTLHPGQPRTRE